MTYQKLSFADYQKVKEERIKKIVDMFRNMKPEELTESVAKAFVTKIGAPCEEWSLMNKVLTERANTADARTFNNWKKVNRNVKVGSRAFFIWKPVSKMVKEYDPKFFGTDEQEKHYKIRYIKFSDPVTKYMEQIGTQFGLQPEFRIEDTDGEAIDYPNKPKELPPLVKVAKKLGLSIQWKKYNIFDGYYGYYSSSRKIIVLSTYDENTFFHELTHGIHKEIQGYLKGGQDKDQETIAEFTACVIASIFGIDTTKGSLKYLRGYNDQSNEEVLKRINKNMSMIEKILDFAFTPVKETKKAKAVTKKEKSKK